MSEATGQIYLISGVPRSGKTTLSKRIAHKFDRVFDLDFFYMWARNMDTPHYSHLLSDRSCSAVCPNDLDQGDFVGSLSAQIERKLFYASPIIVSLITTVQWNMDSAIIEGWMAVAPVALDSPNVSRIFLDIDEDSLFDRLSKTADQFSPECFEQYRRLRHRLLELAAHYKLKVRTFEQALDELLE